MAGVETPSIGEVVAFWSADHDGYDDVPLLSRGERSDAETTMDAGFHVSFAVREFPGGGANPRNGGGTPPASAERRGEQLSRRT